MTNERDDAALDHIQAVLARRAQRLSEPEPVDAEEDVTAVWLAEFEIGDECFALRLGALRSSIPLKLVTPVPLVPAHVLGILRYEGQLVCAFSLVSLLGRAWRSDPSVLIVVQRPRGGLVALDCERIPKPIKVPLSSIESAKQDGELIKVVTTPELRELRLIDLERLLERATTEEIHVG